MLSFAERIILTESVDSVIGFFDIAIVKPTTKTIKKTKVKKANLSLSLNCAFYSNIHNFAIIT